MQQIRSSGRVVDFRTETPGEVIRSENFIDGTTWMVLIDEEKLPGTVYEEPTDGMPFGFWHKGDCTPCATLEERLNMIRAAHVLRELTK